MPRIRYGMSRMLGDRRYKDYGISNRFLTIKNEHPVKLTASKFDRVVFRCLKDSNGLSILALKYSFSNIPQFEFRFGSVNRGL